MAVTYDYWCEKCDEVLEVRHGMNDKPEVRCPECCLLMRKVPSACYLSRGKTIEQRKHEDRFRREGAMRLELKHDHGLEKIRPLGGHTISDIYADVKSRPGFVNEQMARSAAEAERRRKEKAKEWKRKAVRRATPRRLEMERRRAEEAMDKRAIRI